MTAILVGADLTEEQAREVVGRIGSHLERVWEDVKLAFAGRAWLALGYKNWNELCTVEFGTSQLKLPADERKQVVADLHNSGMSTRAVASATGIDDRTVRRDLAGAANAAPETVTGLDGKTYSAAPAAFAAPEVLDAEIVDEETGKSWEEMTTRERSANSACGVDYGEYSAIKGVAAYLTNLTDHPLEPENHKKLVRLLQKTLTKLEETS